MLFKYRYLFVECLCDVVSPCKKIKLFEGRRNVRYFREMEEKLDAVHRNFKNIYRIV